MDEEEFTNAFGSLEKIQDDEWDSYLSFIPYKLPPKIEFDQKLALALSKADSTLSKLSGVGILLPNPDLLVTPYMKKEALSSSRIEGTRISLSEFYLAEAKGDEDKEPNASEVSNYIKAMNHTLQQIKNQPIDLDLIRKMHEILMNQVRGKDKFPGEYRHIQNWIGLPNSKPQDASFVPPPPEKVPSLLQDMVDYLNTYDEMPLLIKTALLHYQFETIHPFCDGNGRIGRALIVLHLCKKNKLTQPLLYISGFFEKHRTEYIRVLAEANKRGNFKEWILFFLKAVKEQSQEALEKATKLQQLKEEYRDKVQDKSKTNLMLQAVDNLFINPYLRITRLKKQIGTTYPTAKRIVEQLQDLNILKQVNDAKRDKIYLAQEIMEIIES
ncbi:MAG: Fic family protein [bacterium]